MVENSIRWCSLYLEPAQTHASTTSCFNLTVQASGKGHICAILAPIVYQSCTVILLVMASSILDAEVTQNIKQLPTGSKPQQRGELNCVARRIASADQLTIAASREPLAAAFLKHAALDTVIILTQDSDTQAKTNALMVLMIISTASEVREILVKQHPQLPGAIMQQLSSSTSDQQLYAVQAISNMSASPSLARAAAEAGAVPTLVQLLRTPPNPTISTAACSALAALSQASEGRALQAARCGVVPAAAKLASSGVTAAHQPAGIILFNICRHLKLSRLPKRQLDQMYEAATHLALHGSSIGSGSTDPRGAGMIVLRYLCVHQPHTYALQAAKAGMLSLVMQQLRGSSDPTFQHSALYLVSALLPVSEEQEVAAAVEAGLVQLAATILRSSTDAGVLDGAVRVLSMLTTNNPAFGRLAAQAGAIPGYLRAVNAGTWQEDRLQAEAIMVLADMLALPCSGQHLQQALDGGIIAMLLRQLKPGAVNIIQGVDAAHKLCLALSQHQRVQELRQVAEALVPLLGLPAGSLEDTTATKALQTVANAARARPAVSQAVLGLGAAELAGRWAASADAETAATAGRLQQVLAGEAGDSEVMLVSRLDLGLHLQALQMGAEQYAEALQGYRATQRHTRDKGSRTCPACGASSKPGGKPLMECSACHAVSYCSGACQRKHWKAHKKSCVAGRTPGSSAAAAAGASASAGGRA